MKTNYIAHDEIYKQRKAEGRPGWAVEEVVAENVAALEEVLEHEYIPKSGRLLELGCGAGDLTLWLAGRGYDAYGLDIAPFAIEWAKEKARERDIAADFRVGDVLDLRDYPDDFFDLVLDGHCFHCIIGEDRKLFLASARRVLKPGAPLLVATMCGEVTGAHVREHFDPQSRCVVNEGIAVRYIGLAGDILDEIRSAGFHVLNWKIKARKDDDEQDDLLVVAVDNVTGDS